MAKTEKASQMPTIMVKVKLQRAGLMLMIMERMEKAGQTKVTGQTMEMIQKAGGIAIANTEIMATMATTVIMEAITLQAAGGEPFPITYTHKECMIYEPVMAQLTLN